MVSCETWYQVKRSFGLVLVHVILDRLELDQVKKIIRVEFHSRIFGFGSNSLQLDSGRYGYGLG